MYYGVAYYPEHWPETIWSTDARDIKAAGMDGVRIGEFAWSKMEPTQGDYDFAWLNRAIEVLGDAGLKIVLCTPTATPPQWMMHQHPEILPEDANGVQMRGGVRKYYCHSSPIYREHCRQIASELGKRYGNNPYVVGWQIDNELGDHDTVRCYCPRCRAAFIEWCRDRYETLSELNDAWGTVFWNQTYSAWEQIDLPYPRREIGLNPGHLLDYYRFASDQAIEFATTQIDALLNTIADTQWITTNVIPTYWEIDFKRLGEKLDFLSWDCYTIIDATSPVRQPPVGPSPPVSIPPRAPMISLVHDMMRHYSKKPFWVMETAGQDRLVTYHTMAHGGGGVNFFRWRDVRFGAEQGRGGYAYHGIFSPRFHESQRIASELDLLREKVTGTQYTAQAGLLCSIEMGWAYDIQYVYPRSRWIDGVGYWRLVEEVYTRFWENNVPLEPLDIADDLSMYPVIIIPCLYLTTPEIDQKLADYVADGGTLIVGPASGTKNWHNAYIETLPPHGLLKELFGCELIAAGATGFFSGDLTDGAATNLPSIVQAKHAPFASGKTFAYESSAIDQIGFFSSARPTEVLRITTAGAMGHYTDGQIAWTMQDYGNGQAIYLGFHPNEDFWTELLNWLAESGKITPLMATPKGVEVTRRSLADHDLLFVVNHNFVPITLHLPEACQDILNDRIVEGEFEIAAQSCYVLL